MTEVTIKSRQVFRVAPFYPQLPRLICVLVKMQSIFSDLSKYSPLSLMLSLGNLVVRPSHVNMALFLTVRLHHMTHYMQSIVNNFPRLRQKESNFC